MYRSESTARARHGQIIKLALQGLTRNAIAEQMDFSTATLTRYLNTPAVQAELAACRAAIVAKALGDFEEVYSLALRHYKEQMESPFVQRETKLKVAAQVIKLAMSVHVPDLPAPPVIEYEGGESFRPHGHGQVVDPDPLKLSDSDQGGEIEALGAFDPDPDNGAAERRHEEKDFSQLAHGVQHEDHKRE